MLNCIAGGTFVYLAMFVSLANDVPETHIYAIASWRMAFTIPSHLLTLYIYEVSPDLYAVDRERCCVHDSDVHGV